MDDNKVSVIIPTYNRFKYLLNTIESVKNQTYKNLEIIIVNDASSEKSYYDYDWKDIIIIHANPSSREKFNRPAPGYIRNIGIEKATGKYIAFCDDDDIWLPGKLEHQIREMKESGCKISSTEGYCGAGIYDKSIKYPLYNNEYWYNKIKKKFNKSGMSIVDNGYPKIWDYKMIKVHNCIITSSVVIDRFLLSKVNGMGFERRGQDYKYWLKCLQHTDLVYIDLPYFYYDITHGNGKNH